AIPAEESAGTWRRADAVSPAMDGDPGRVLLVLAVEAAGVHPAGGASCTAAGGGVSAQADGGTDESELSAAGGACFACGDIDCGTADCAGKDAEVAADATSGVSGCGNRGGGLFRSAALGGCAGQCRVAVCHVNPGDSWSDVHSEDGCAGN